jgi:hypothetical protein
MSPRQPGEISWIGLACWPKIRLATCVPWFALGSSSERSETKVSNLVILALLKHGCVRSTGPSRIAMQVSASPTVHCRISFAFMINTQIRCLLRVNLCNVLLHCNYLSIAISINYLDPENQDVQLDTYIYIYCFLILLKLFYTFVLCLF